MKKGLVIGALASILMFSGCSNRLGNMTIISTNN